MFILPVESKSSQSSDDMEKIQKGNQLDMIYIQVTQVYKPSLPEAESKAYKEQSVICLLLPLPRISSRQTMVLYFDVVKDYQY